MFTPTIIILLITLALTFGLYYWTQSIYFTSAMICSISLSSLISFFIWKLLNLGKTDWINLENLWTLIPIGVFFGILALMDRFSNNETYTK